MSTLSQKTTATLEQASHWVSLLHSGDYTAAQKQAFQKWLAKSEAHQQAYQEVEAFWQQLDGLESVAKPQLEVARALAHNTQRRRRLPSWQSLALAASIILIVTAIPFWQLILDNGTYRTAKGEQTHIQLSDGSRIDLNTDTELRVSYSWFSRTVKLEHGEALFSVNHNAEKPFEVVAADGRIRDIGTRFNVYRQGDQVAVTVLEGEVSVTNDQTSDPQALTAGMQLTYYHGDLTLLENNVDVSDAVAWREGRLVFKRQSLTVVLEQLARYHAVRISTSNPKLQSLKVSGSFPTDDLNLALKTIAASLPIKVTQVGAGQIVLSDQGKLQR